MQWHKNWFYSNHHKFVGRPEKWACLKVVAVDCSWETETKKFFFLKITQKMNNFQCVGGDEEMVFPISRFFVFLEFAPRLKMTRMIIS